MSTQPKGPPLAHSKWHAIENPKSEWCKPQRHPKSARSLHLTDCPWCLHVRGGFVKHFCHAWDACDIEESPQQSLSVSSIFTPLSRGGGKCSLYIIWVLFGLSARRLNRHICNVNIIYIYILIYNLHLPLLKLRVWLRCDHDIIWIHMIRPTKKTRSESMATRSWLQYNIYNSSNRKKSRKRRRNLKPSKPLHVGRVQLLVVVLGYI